MTLVAGAAHPLNITISWTALATGTGGVAITFYAVEYSSASSTSGFVQVNSYTEGLYTTYTHVVSTTFTGGAPNYYRVRAVNSVGYSTVYSAVISIVAPSIPLSQTAPVLVTGSVHPYNISMTWSDPGSPANGGDAISFFLLQWYNTYTSSWVNVTTYPSSGLVTSITHVATQLFTPTVAAQY